MGDQLKELSRVFPANYIKKKGTRGDSYVPHAIVKQRLLQVCDGYDFYVIREIYDGEKLTGVLAELRVKVDGKISVIQEFGDVEQDQSNNASNAKHAISDAFKRCCAHIGLGLHLWSQDDYFLFNKLSQTEKEAVDQATDLTIGGSKGKATNTPSVSLNKIDAEDDVPPVSDIRTNGTSEMNAEQSNNGKSSNASKTKLDQRLEEIKKSKIDNPQQGRTKIDEKTGQTIKYKYDR